LFVWWVVWGGCRGRGLGFRVMGVWKEGWVVLLWGGYFQGVD